MLQKCLSLNSSYYNKEFYVFSSTHFVHQRMKHIENTQNKISLMDQTLPTGMFRLVHFGDDCLPLLVRDTNIKYISPLRWNTPGYAWLLKLLGDSLNIYHNINNFQAQSSSVALLCIIQCSSQALRLILQKCPCYTKWWPTWLRL